MQGTEGHYTKYKSVTETAVKTLTIRWKWWEDWMAAVFTSFSLFYNKSLRSDWIYKTKRCTEMDTGRLLLSLHPVGCHKSISLVWGTRCYDASQCPQMSPNIVSIICWHEKQSFWHTLGEGEQTQVDHFVSELCLSSQNETCCGASAFCCVYTVHATHGSTGGRARQHLHCLFLHASQENTECKMTYRPKGLVCDCFYTCNSTKEFTVFKDEDSSNFKFSPFPPSLSSTVHYLW